MFVIEGWNINEKRKAYFSGLFQNLVDASSALFKYANPSRCFLMKKIECTSFPVYIIENEEGFNYTSDKEDIIQYAISCQLNSKEENHCFFKLYTLNSFIEVDENGNNKLENLNPLFATKEKLELIKNNFDFLLQEK